MRRSSRFDQGGSHHALKRLGWIGPLCLSYLSLPPHGHSLCLFTAVPRLAQKASRLETERPLARRPRFSPPKFTAGWIVLLPVPTLTASVGWAAAPCERAAGDRSPRRISPAASSVNTRGHEPVPGGFLEVVREACHLRAVWAQLATRRQDACGEETIKEEARPQDTSSLTRATWISPSPCPRCAASRFSKYSRTPLEKRMNQ